MLFSTLKTFLVYPVHTHTHTHTHRSTGWTKVRLEGQIGRPGWKAGFVMMSTLSGKSNELQIMLVRPVNKDQGDSQPAVAVFYSGNGLQFFLLHPVRTSAAGTKYTSKKFNTGLFPAEYEAHEYSMQCLSTCIYFIHIHKKPSLQSGIFHREVGSSIPTYMHTPIHKLRAHT